MDSTTSNKKRGRNVLLIGAAILVYMAASSLIRNNSGGGTATPFAPASERRLFTPLQGTTFPDGSPWRLASLKGKVVLLNYAATWCPPCLRETPDLVAASNRYQSQGVEIVGLMMDEGEKSSFNAAVEQYARQYDISYSLVRPQEDPLLQFSGLGLPTSVLLDRQGRLVRTYVGPIAPSGLATDIERLLQERDPLPHVRKS